MDIGLAVGGVFLSSVLQVLFDWIAPQGELLKMFQKDKRDVRLLKKLRMTLLGLQVVLSDAENKQSSDPCVSLWLNELQDAVDNAENLMDEINYEVLRLKVECKPQDLGETSKQQVSGHNLCLSDDYYLKIKERLEDTVETLAELQKQIGDLGLIKTAIDSGKKDTRIPSTSVVDESDIFGRHDQIEELVDRLLSVDGKEKNLTIIPIVGMGGIGKTTLAQAAYNDERVQEYFKLKAWVCVSEPFDVLAITKGILQEIGSFDSKDNKNLNQLQIKLKERLKAKKFLVVLDDVWNEKYNEWNVLRNLFVGGDGGSKIVVTTRKENVALMMGSGAINVGILSAEVSWNLFKQHSFENRDPEEQLELEKVGKQIAVKCKGLPLALKTLAGMLRSKSKIEEWRNILRNEWELPSHSNDILPALRLSYNDLPVHLKRCFSYCAIFPKDYPFCKEQVVHLWIANGLVKGFHLGQQYFLELRSRSLFERVPKSSQGNIEKFLMHDLVNDLAKIASSNLCIRLEENEGSHVLERSRHLSYSMDCQGDFGKLRSLGKLEQLRTLLPINFRNVYYYPTLSKRVLHNILPTLTSLRALSLSHYCVKELPDVLFIHLKLLRHLDLSSTMIKRLPDSVLALYNLDTLLLTSCEYLEELPPQMEKLINLRHLDIIDCPRLKMQLHLNKLKSLHVLSGAKFFLDGCGGSSIRDLGELHNLYGSLSILELQNMADKGEVVKANMRGKEHIERLSFEWSGGIAESSQNERDILDSVRPNANIKELNIKGYRGTKFPDWLGDQLFLKLVKLSLSNCNDCDYLPALGQLPSLKFLAILEMHRITELTEVFYGDSSSRKPFNSLEKLEFAKIPEWEKWHVLGIGEFPALQDLSIDDCPKLIGRLPENLCSWTRLKISKCPNFSLETPIPLSSLKYFEVSGSPKVGVLFDDAELFSFQLQGMNQLVILKIDGCDSITSLPISRLSNTLKEIHISRCGKLKLEPSDGEMISSRCGDMFGDRLKLQECHSIDELVLRTRELRVVRCHGLTKLLIPTGTEDMKIHTCENLEILSVAYGTETMSLCHLEIHDCKKLKSLPEQMQEPLPSLKELKLSRCPEIKSFPEGGLPFSLEVLVIRNCKKLVNGRKEWCLQRLPCLRELIISHDGSDEEIHWELPCSIRRLEINNLKTISRQVLKGLTSLEYLYASDLPHIWSLLEEGLPSSLSQLLLSHHDELYSLPIEGLRRLTSLQSLRISFCSQLQSIPESALPSSLSVLTILGCPNLQSLSVKGMSKLSIHKCPKLKPLLEFGKGGYWPKIAHIPTLEIDNEYQ